MINIEQMIAHPKIIASLISEASCSTLFASRPCFAITQVYRILPLANSTTNANRNLAILTGHAPNSTQATCPFKFKVTGTLSRRRWSLWKEIFLNNIGCFISLQKCKIAICAPTTDLDGATATKNAIVISEIIRLSVNASHTPKTSTRLNLT